MAYSSVDAGEAGAERDGWGWRLVEAEPGDVDAAWDASAVDFGAVYEGLRGRARFALARPPDVGAVRIGRLMAGCECVEAALSARTAEPGEPVFLSVRFHSGGLSRGHKRYAVVAELLEPDARLLGVDISAEVVPAPSDPLWRPTAFFVAGDDSAAGEVVLMNLSRSPLRVESLTAEGEGITVETPVPLALAAGASRTIRVRRAAGADGAAGGGVWVATDRPAHARFRIPLVGGE